MAGHTHTRTHTHTHTQKGGNGSTMTTRESTQNVHNQGSMALLLI